jgi:hypothetical protein|tara:strand:+ start:1407 stop:1868 length:462 start_codon:yes stop_codon:yes gene_type:complete
MLLGFAAFAEQPFSTVAEDSNVIISTNANALTFAIGNYSIIAGTIVEVVAADPLDITSIMPTVTTTANITPDPNALIFSIGTPVISGDANVTTTSNALTITTTEPTVTGSAVVSVSGNPLTFTVNDTGVIVWNPIDPNPGNVWVPIKPYGGTP